MRTFFIETWGCQMNHHDSERIEGQLRRHGLEPAPLADAADVVVLNTCSVREKPVQKIHSRIGSLTARERPPVIGVCGCVAQQEGESFLERSRAVGFVLGPRQISRLGDAIRALEHGRRTVLIDLDSELEVSFESVFRRSPTRGMVTVIDGCNEFCTFCIVPYTRGREKSRLLSDILDEVRHLASTGLHEVELLGQTINAYCCPQTGAAFPELLEAVARVAGLDRVRYITSHPRRFDDRLIRVLSQYPQVSRYLHLPFQAGSNAILHRMRRRYTREEYLDIVARLRRAVPEINLSSDVIVGFPGETEKDFQHTLDLLESVRFGQVYAFAFSPRPNTPATRYSDQVADSVKSERLQRLFAVSDRISHELNSALVGRTVDVLIDGPSRRSQSDWQGRAEDNRVVNFPVTGSERVGEIVNVRVVNAGAHSLRGEIADPPARLPVVLTRPSSPDTRLS